MEPGLSVPVRHAVPPESFPSPNLFNRPYGWVRRGPVAQRWSVGGYTGKQMSDSVVSGHRSWSPENGSFRSEVCEFCSDSISFGSVHSQKEPADWAGRTAGACLTTITGPSE